jgi:hypothetical protein
MNIADWVNSEPRKTHEREFYPGYEAPVVHAGTFADFLPPISRSAAQTDAYSVHLHERQWTRNSRRNASIVRPCTLVNMRELAS